MTTFSVQPDPTTGLDTYLYLGNVTSTVGKTNAEIKIGKTSSSSYVFRGAIKFDVSSIPSGATVSSATLSLYYELGTDGVSNTIKVYRFLVPWVLAYACWNNRDNGTAWNTAGGFDANDCEQTEIGTTGAISDITYGWKDISLTPSKVQEWISGALTNNGLMLKATDESTTNCNKNFFAADYTTDTTLRPKLTINYTAGGALKHITMSSMQHLTGGFNG